MIYKAPRQVVRLKFVQGTWLSVTLSFQLLSSSIRATFAIRSIRACVCVCMCVYTYCRVALRGQQKITLIVTAGRYESLKQLLQSVLRFYTANCVFYIT